MIVVGYGAQKKATLTGSVSQVSGKDLVSVGASNLSNTIAGKTAGVIANTRTGEPGEDYANILIRGKGTLGATNPLIVVDGVADRSFSKLNPEDIESISVLKDASAAIYGARAANGVILVTTKRSKGGKMQVSYDGNVSFSQPTRIPKMLNAYDYATYIDEYDAGHGEAQTYSDEVLEQIKSGKDQVKYPSTNWWKEVTKDWAFNTTHSVSVSGGSDKLSMYTSGQYQYQNAIYKDSPQNYHQFQLVSNIDAQITKSIRFSLDILGRQEQRNRSVYSTDDMFGYFLTTNPMSAPYYPNGLLRVGYDGVTNNAAVMVSDKPGWNKSTNYTLNLKPKLHVDLDVVTPGLYAEGYAALDYWFNNGKQLNKPYDVYQYDSETDQYNNRKSATGSISLGSWASNSFTQTVNLRLGYTHTFNKEHKIDAFVAYEQSKYKYNYLYGYRTNYISSALPDLNFGSKVDKDKDNAGSSDETARQNYFGRINYSYKDKYLFEATLRYDGSMNFAPGKRWGLFPAFSAGWVLSEEKFFEPVKNIVNFMKIKGSWGLMGNDNIGAYQYLSLYSYNGDASYVFGENYSQGIYENVTANTNVTWEKANTWNGGFSAQFLNGKFGLDFDYFYSRRSDILITRNASVPTYSGLSLPAENLGKVSNHGLEIVASYNDKAGDFTWGVTGNFTYAKNKVIYMDEAAKTPEWQRMTGHSIDGYVLYKALGIYQTQEQINNSPHIDGAHVGDLIYQDTNGDKKITWDDAVRIDKSTTPRIMYGFTLNGSWKELDLNMFFQGQADAQQIVMPTLNMAQEFFDGRWKVNGTAEENANAVWPRAFIKQTYGDTWNGPSSTWWLRNAAFLRFKSFEVGYTLPKHLVASIGLEKVRFYINGNNLFTIDKMKIFDPEMTGGIKGYPIQRTFAFGANIIF
jgi:TonB-linked SusC/RagA family outer membrane protein